MKATLLFLLCLFIGIAAAPLFGQNASFSEFPRNDTIGYRNQRGIYLGAVYSQISNPIFRYPSGYEEISVPQSSTVPGFLAGYQFDFMKFGAGARVIYWKTSFDNFYSQDMPGSQTFVNYADPKFTHISFDLIGEWIATKKIFLGIYMLIGMASSTKSYTISGPTFPEWNGPKNITAFDYSWGIGLKVTPIKWISAIAEIRWIQGDKTTDLEFLYTKGNYNYYKSGDSYTKNKTPIASVGLTIHPESFWNKNKVPK